MEHASLTQSPAYHKGSTSLLDKPASDTNNIPEAQQVEVAAGALILPGLLRIPDNAHGLALLAHGSNNIESDAHYDELAAGLYQAGLATLFVHLLSEEE